MLSVCSCHQFGIVRSCKIFIYIYSFIFLILVLIMILESVVIKKVSFTTKNRVDVVIIGDIVFSESVENLSFESILLSLDCLLDQIESSLKPLDLMPLIQFRDLHKCNLSYSLLSYKVLPVLQGSLYLHIFIPFAHTHRTENCCGQALSFRILLYLYIIKFLKNQKKLGTKIFFFSNIIQIIIIFFAYLFYCLELLADQAAIIAVWSESLMFFDLK